MEKKIIIAMFTIFAGLVWGCDENRMPEYENSPALYFSWSTGVNEQRDSINHSFFLLPSVIMRDTVWVEVRTMGESSPEARPVSIVQTNAGKPDAATAGTHYISFDTPGIKDKMVVPANAVKARIPVVFLRHESLDLQKVRLELAVAENDHFRPGIDAWRNFVLTTTALTEKPKLWDEYWSYRFGPTWGPRKFRFIIDATGFMDWDSTLTDENYSEYLRTTVLQRFAEYNRDNPLDPLKEANDDLVEF